MPNYKYIVDFIANTKKFNDEVATAGKTVSRVMGSVAGIAAGVFSVNQVMNFVQASTEAYNVSAQNEMSLLVALKGRADVQARLIDQANELAGKSLFEDDEIIRAQSLVAAFVKEESQIKKLLPVIMDFAAAKKVDLASAADLVTKSFAGEVNALGRYGISLTEASGTADRLEEIQLKLNNAFGGQAEASAKVGTAAIQQLTNEYGNLQEVIGKLLISQSNQEGSFTKILTEATRGVTGFLSKVATWSEAGLGLKQSLMGAIWGDDEDTKKLGIVMADYQAKQMNLQKSAEKSATAVKGQADAQKEYVERLNETYALMATGRGTGNIQISGGIEAGGLSDMSDFMDANLQKVDDLNTRWQSYIETMYQVADAHDYVQGGLSKMDTAVLAFTENMMQMAYSGQVNLENLGASLYEVATDSIRAYIAEGVAGAVSKALGFLPFPFNLAAGAMAAVTATSLFNSVIPKFADGGIVSGPTLGIMGEYPGAASNPEVIAPLSKLQGMMGNRGGQDRIFIAETRIKKGDLYIMYKEAEKERYKRT